MGIRWTQTPDRFEGDLAVGPLYADRPPTRGVAGWCDWRLGEPVATAVIAGRVAPRRGERFLVAGRPPFGARRILLIGGPRPAENPGDTAAWAAEYALAMGGLGCRRVLIETPGGDPDAFLLLLAEKLGGAVPPEMVAYVAEEPCRT